MKTVFKIGHCAPAFFSSAILTIAVAGAAAQERPLYLDASQPIEARINNLLPQLTLEEKVSLVHGNANFTTAGVPRLGIPELWMDDGPLGVREEVGEQFRIVGRTDDFATAMPGDARSGGNLESPIWPGNTARSSARKRNSAAKTSCSGRA